MKKKAIILAAVLMIWTILPVSAAPVQPSDGLLWAAALEEGLQDSDWSLISPLSLETALKMAAHGARGETQSQILGALGEDELDLERMSARLKKLKQGGVVSASGLYVEGDASLEAAYTGDLKRTLNAQYFTQQGAELKSALEQWICEATQGLIREYPFEVVKQEEGEQTAVLLNALSLKAKWKKPFIEAEKGIFHGADRDAEVEMLSQVADYAYQQTEDGVQCVYLPYVSGNLGMTVLLPGEEGLEELLKRLQADPAPYLNTAAQPMRSVAFSMPKLEMRVKSNLKQTLERAMPLAFGDLADFSGMSGKNELKIGDVLQNVYLVADEEGTEAAAATEVLIVPKCALIYPTEMRVDRPYVFLIHDLAGENILFAGAVRNFAQ